MNILLVDDDAYVLEALQKTLDWETLGIRNVYSAQSVNKARKIIEDIPIHILICDIEMPKENGFELLKWVRDKQYIMKEILLTSYAEFKYANEAIKFGCYAYSLKPIDYGQLEEMILGAVKEEKRALSLVNHEKYYEYWTASLKIRKEQFFRELLIERKAPKLQDYDLNYQKEQLFLPLILRCSESVKEMHLHTKMSSEMSIEDAYSEHLPLLFVMPQSGIMSGSVSNYDSNGKGMFEWTINNLINEVYTTDRSAVEAVLLLNNDELLVILHMDYNQIDVDSINKYSDTFIKKIHKNMELTCSVVVGTISRLDYLPKEVADFLVFMSKKLVEYGEVITLKNYVSQNTDYYAPDFMIWERLLKSGQEQAVKKEVFKYLDRQNAVNNLDKDVLKRLITGLIQLLTGVLNENDINPYQMGEALFNTDMIHQSTKNVSNAKSGIGQMIDTVMNMIKRPEKDKPIVQIVKEYIDNNLDQDLTREALAERVYLNQDYLARIFKKEIGESIVNYITGKRIEVAKAYLDKTNESVNSIAIRVGYDNFSYFTKIFKDRVGMTPKEYRRIHGLKENSKA